MLRRMLSVIALSVAVAFTFVSVGCGYILHPERRGAKGGQVDGLTVLFDCLWLLVGIIPGVVALVVDFTTGAVYQGGGRGYLVNPDGKVAVRLPPVKSETKLELRLTTPDGKLLDSATKTLSPGESLGDSISVDLARATKLLGDDARHLKLQLRNDKGRTANLDLQVK